MQYNVAQLLQDDIGTVRLHELDEPPYMIDPGIEAVAPLTGRVRLMRTNRGVLADVDLTTQLHLECSRCLEDVSVPMHTRFTEEFYPTVDLRTGLAVKAPEGGTGFMLTEAHELDLTEPVRQQVLLDLPMQPLCRADCAGLCPSCGHNLNQGPCECAREPADARLGTLAQWLKANEVNSR